MAIKRFTANKDTTITNAYKSSLLDNQRATGSNMGASDVLEIFSIYGQSSGSVDGKNGSGELSRALLEFPVNEISEARTASDIPASGSVDFYLRMFNAEHAFTTPSNYSLQVVPISQSWAEGYGLDMEEYKDKTNDGVGSNWMRSTENTSWEIPGGDFDYEPKYSVSFDKGHEDLEVNITELVEEWLSQQDSTSGDQRINYGIGVFLDSQYEAYHSSSALVSTADVVTGPPNDGVLLHNVTGSQRSYYTKKFFSRTSEYFFKRPIIEARWDSSIKDDRGNFYASSSLMTAAENLNTIYLYNVVRGQLRNLPDVGTGPIFVQIYDEPDSGSVQTVQNSGSETREDYSTWQITNNFITGGYVSTGIYSCSFAIDTTSSVVYDRWFAEGNPSTPILGTGYSAICYHTGTINVKNLNAADYNPNKKYVSRITNLKPSYSRDENARFRLFVREKDWCPTVYTKATQDIESTIIDEAYYKIIRIEDNETVVDYGTGSLQHTLLSYDVKGNYFDFDVSSLEKGYSYGIKLVYRRDSVYHEQSETFKFRVE
tara:strand:+ start:5915 stop:7543 length:1629 start_codon:yes stop_codon:yes gene_type:complete